VITKYEVAVASISRLAPVRSQNDVLQALLMQWILTKMHERLDCRRSAGEESDKLGDLHGEGERGDARIKSVGKGQG
jgi:hypothetical protein